MHAYKLRVEDKHITTFFYLLFQNILLLVSKRKKITHIQELWVKRSVYLLVYYIENITLIMPWLYIVENFAF